LAFYCRSGHDHRSLPVAKSDFRTHRLLSGFRSPSGFLNPFGSMRPAQFQTLRFAFASRPIFLRSPPRLYNYLSLCASDQCAGARPLPRSGRNPPLDTAFRSPAATIYLAANLRGRVNVPGLHLRGDSEILSWPVRPRTPAPVWLFIAARGTIIACCPLPSPISELSVCCQASAPRRDFSIPSAQCAQPDSKR